jgi:hypothetical protein
VPPVTPWKAYSRPRLYHVEIDMAPKTISHQPSAGPDPVGSVEPGKAQDDPGICGVCPEKKRAACGGGRRL